MNIATSQEGVLPCLDQLVAEVGLVHIAEHKGMVVSTDQTLADLATK